MPPIISSIQPAGAAPGSALTITGTGFAAGAMVRFACANGEAQAIASFVSATEVRVVLPDLLSGLAGSVLVSASNPEDGLFSAEVACAVPAWPPVEDVFPLCSLGELKASLGIAADDTSSDAKLLDRIRTASAQIQGCCGRSFQIVEIVDELHDGDGTDVLELDVTPIVSVSAVSIDGQPVDVSELAVYLVNIAFPDTGEWNARLRSYSRVFSRGRNNIKVSYRAGYAAVPRDVSDACKIQVAFLENTLSKQGIVSETNQVAQASTTYAQSQLALPVRVTCNRYRRGRMRAV